MTTFIPEDAFAASFDKDGSVTTELANPAAIPTIVADFTVDNENFKAVYHDSRDVWEVFGDGDKWIVAHPGHEFYGYAEQTVAAFKDKLLSGPCPDALRKRLTDAMAKEIQAEIDADIIRDLQIASGMQPPTIFIPQFSAIPTTPRKLKARWTKETQEEFYPTIPIKSRLFNMPVSGATATY